MDLFRGSRSNFEPITMHIQNRLDHEDNATLIRPLENEEFKKTFFQMLSDKALGPDGLNSTFFKRFWNLCGVELFHTDQS